MILKQKFPIESMPTFYAKADALLLTLKKEYIFSITVPAKLQSYLACGRPILTMLDGEGSTIVNNAKAGLICEAGDYHSLAKNVLYMYGLNKEEINKYCNNARQYYLDNFDRNKLLTQIEKRLRLPERLRPTGAFAPPSSFGEKIISFPQRMISGINFRFPSISFPSISFGGAGGAISSVGSAVGNNFLSSVFNLGGRTGSILSFGRGAAGAVGQKAVTFWGKYYLIIIGIIGFAFFTGFINLPLNSNIVYEVGLASSAFTTGPGASWTVADESWSEIP